MSDALLEYAYRRIVELEKLLLVDVAETVWPAEVRLVYSQIERAGNYRRITRTVYAITSIACGWNKCPYRQSWTPPNRWPSLWRNTRERNHR
jgi:predicted transcriptional regulator of viral defense system